MTNLELHSLHNPFANLCGLRVIQGAGGNPELTADYRPEFCNPYGRLHGGWIAAIVDTASGYNALTTMRAPVTVDCTIHYYRNITGGTVHTRTTVVKPGRTICVLRVALLTEDDTLLAEGDFTYMDTAPAPRETGGSANG